MTPQSRSYGARADLALKTFVKLVRAHNTLCRLEGRHIRQDFGLTQPQFAVIDGIGHLGPMSMGELSEKMLVTGGNTTVVIDNLESAGLVRRRPSETDRRSTVVELTEAGQATFERVFPEHADYMARAFSALDAQEQRTLGDLLRKLGLALAQHGVPQAGEAHETG